MPPFSAGVDSGVNHPGVISGLHTQGLDGAGGSSQFNQWAIDDASGQLRMRLLASTTGAELGLGHLIAQGANSAQRGASRGSGFEAGTQGWGSLRAARGLLVSTSARAGSYGSAQGSQMDAAEALAQLRSATDLGTRLGDAATTSGALGLASLGADDSVAKVADAVDPKKSGRHEGSVNGQQALKAGADGRTLADAVDAFEKPLVVLDTPSVAVFTSEAGIAAFSGQDLSVAVQGDVQLTAGATLASVSGQTSSLYAHQGGIKAFAANGAVSLRAHTDSLKILADKAITVVSVNDAISIAASSKIELIAGQSSIVLDGANITFTTPGAFAAKFSAHAFLGAGSGAASLPVLPADLTAIQPNTMYLEHRYHDDEGLGGASYELLLPDGSKKTGTLDGQGKAAVDGVQAATAEVSYGPAAGAYERKDKTPTPAHDASPADAKLSGLVDKYYRPAQDADTPKA